MAAIYQGGHQMDSKPFRDLITGRKISIPCPINKAKVTAIEMDEYFNCFEEEIV